MNAKKKISVKKLLVVMLLVLLMIGCAYASNEQIDEIAAREQAVNELRREVENAEEILSGLEQGKTVAEEPVAKVTTEEQATAEAPCAYKKLSPDEADVIIRKLTEEEESLKFSLAELQKQIDALKTKAPTMDTKIAEPEVEKADLDKKPEQISRYEVKAGDYLRKIAERSEIYGYGQYARWKDIYKANRDKIRNPDLIRPGWILIIPRP